MTWRAAVVGLMSGILLAPSAATAQVSDGGTVRQLDQLSQCRAMTDDKERLACFDRASAAILASRAAGDLMVLDRKAVIARKQSRFGLAVPTSEMFGGGRADEVTDVRQLDSTIKTASAAKAYGRWNLELANGSVWQTVDALTFGPSKGDAITLKEAPLGGYRATIAGGRSILVKRIR
ncbi:hypothetical protein QE385_002442 [Sphingomonas sp. SORGH_AS 950]|nr:hypothetical protein [Sphingomonas sp. SORGH_AS_0950]